jgi:hypothetical protein
MLPLDLWAEILGHASPEFQAGQQTAALVFTWDLLNIDDVGRSIASLAMPSIRLL